MQKLQCTFLSCLFSGYHSSEVAIGDVSLPPLAAPRGNELLPPQTNHQRGMRDPPMLTKAAGPSGAKVQYIGYYMYVFTICWIQTVIMSSNFLAHLLSNLMCTYTFTSLLYIQV